MCSGTWGADQSSTWWDLHRKIEILIELIAWSEEIRSYTAMKLSDAIGRVLIEKPSKLKSQYFRLNQSLDGKFLHRNVQQKFPLWRKSFWASNLISFSLEFSLLLLMSFFQLPPALLLWSFIIIRDQKRSKKKILIDAPTFSARQR